MKNIKGNNKLVFSFLSKRHGQKRERFAVFAFDPDSRETETAAFMSWMDTPVGSRF